MSEFYNFEVDNEEDVQRLHQLIISDDMAVQSDYDPDSDVDDDMPPLSASTSGSLSESTSREGTPNSTPSSTPLPVRRQLRLVSQQNVFSAPSSPNLPGPSTSRAELPPPPVLRISSDDDHTDSDTSDIDFAPEGLRWKKKTRKPKKFNNFKYCQPPTGPSHHAVVDISSPMKIFVLFFTEVFLEHMVYHSNLYAVQRKTSLDIDVEELKVFLGMLIIMGFHTLPSMRLYWSQNRNFRVERILGCMPIKRFLKVLRHLHMTDNTMQPSYGQEGFDVLYKVRPMLNYMNARFKKLYYPSRWMAIDESMVKFKGRSSLKQYMPMKPIKRGFKVWVLCDSETGYALDLNVYTGREDGASSEIGLGGRVVEKATKCYQNKGFMLYFDNFFSSIKLAGRLLLRGFFCCSTLRPNRRGFPYEKLKSDSSMRKGGDFDCAQAGDISVLKWRDRGRKPVCMLSTIHNPSDFETKTRRGSDGKNEEAAVPKPIADYNVHMGGVDLFDQLLETYTIAWKSRRWWMKLFYYFTDAAIVNSYILYKTTFTKVHPNRKPLTHLQFRSELADELIGSYSSSKKTGRRISSTEERFEKVGEHLPIRLPTKERRCANCALHKRRSRSQLGCVKCNVALCMDCFIEYHTSADKK